MSRFLFVSWDGAGNQAPALGIAQALAARGHDVLFCGSEQQRALVEARGFQFRLLSNVDAGPGADRTDPIFAALTREGWTAPRHLGAIPELVTVLRSDALVIDGLMFAALAAAETLRLPAFVLVHSAPGALVPPEGLLDRFLVEPINRVRAMANLPAVANVWNAWSRLPALCTTATELDPLADLAPPSFDYIGPCRDILPPSGWQSPWRPDDPRPLVLASFSTGRVWDQSSRLRLCIDACSALGVRLVATHGAIDLAGLPRPADAVLLRHLPHDEILPHAVLTITHAGHGTVAASLAHGVPLLCLPNAAADQPTLAARIEHLGAGLALDADRVTSADLAGAIRRILADRRFAAAARRLAGTLASLPGTAGAANRLERAVAARSRPCTGEIRRGTVARAKRRALGGSGPALRRERESMR